MRNLIRQWLALDADINELIAQKEKLNKDFYLQQTLKVAEDLIGKVFVKIEGKEILAGIIAETEAYLGDNDRASHSYRGVSKRNEAMFEEGGILYIYKIFGIHYCANIVTEQKDVGSAVLLRSLIPISGIEKMQNRRKTSDLYKLCRGPGNSAKSLSLDYLFNKHSLLDDKLFILNTSLSEKYIIAKGSRIGISKDEHLPYRFFIYNCPFVSGKKIFQNAQKILNS